VTRIGELPIVSMMKEALSSDETSTLTRATRRDIREDGILDSHRRENLKPYINIPFVKSVSELAPNEYSYDLWQYMNHVTIFPFTLFLDFTFA
jgi:hypothetical protein